MAGQLTAEAAAQLQEGINLTLSRWTALQMAVENQWGGPNSRQKSLDLSNKIFSLFTESKQQVYIDDVEDLMDDCMLSLNTQIGDGSIEEIAEQLMYMHEECLEGKFTTIEKLRQTIPATPAVCIKQPASDDDSDEDEDMGDEDAPQMATTDMDRMSLNDDMVEDHNPAEAAEVEDGWTVVPSRRNKGRKNGPRKN